MSPNEPLPIFRTKRNFPPTWNSDRVPALVVGLCAILFEKIQLKLSFQNEEDMYYIFVLKYVRYFD